MRSRMALGLACAVLVVVGTMVLRPRTPEGTAPPSPKIAVARGPSAPPIALPPIPKPPRRFDLPKSADSQKEKLATAIGIARNHVVKEWDGIYAYNTQTFGATLDHGRIEVSPNFGLEGIGAPRLAYTLSEIRCGRSLVAAGGRSDATFNQERQTISFSRGTVTEKYVLGSEGLEQVFVLTELPADRGTLRISGRLETNLTPPAEGTKGASISLTYKDAEVLSLSKALARDHAGNTLELPLAYGGGQAVLEVPADWLSKAVLPIEIDPLIGSPVTVRSSITGFVTSLNGQFVRVCDMVDIQNGGYGYVAWSERVGASTFDYNIYGQTITQSGTLSGSVISIATTTNGEYECALSYGAPLASGAGMILAVWREDPADNNDVTDQRISGRVLNGDGSIYSPIFVIDNPPGQNYAPSVAFDTAQWFVTYTHVVSATDHNILGRFVTPAGIPGARVTIDGDPDMASRSTVAFDGNDYVIGWEKTSGSVMGIVARSMDPNGYFPGSIVPISQNSGLDCRLPDVAFGEGLFLITWQVQNSTTDHDIFGRICDHNFRFQTSPLSIFTGPSNQQYPRSAFNPDTHAWYVVATDSATGNTDVYGKLVGLTGRVAATADQISSGAAPDVYPTVAAGFGTGKAIVTYITGSASPYQLLGQVVGMPAVLQAPSGLSPTADGPSGIYWTWSGGITGIQGYEILDNQNFLVATFDPTVTNFTDGGFQANSAVTRKIRTFNGAQGSQSILSTVGYTTIGAPANGTMQLTPLAGGWSVEIDIAVPTGGFLGWSGWQGQRSKLPDFSNKDGSLVYVGPGARHVWTCIDPNVQPNTQYYYRYQTFDQNDNASPWTGGTGIFTPNAPPKSFSGTAASSSSINWSFGGFLAGTPESGFVITDENGVTKATGASSPILETGLPENSRTVRTARTIYNGSNSPASLPVGVYTLVHDALAANFTVAVAPGGNLVTVAEPISPYAGQTGIQVFNSTNNSSWSRVAYQPGGYTFTDSNIVGNTLYYYKIAYMNGDAVASGYSPVTSITSGPGKPAAPTGLVAAPQGTSSIQWSWAAVASATSYQLYNIDTNPYTFLVGQTGLSYVETNLPENTAHFRIVRATNVMGQSGDSGYAQGSTLVHNALAGDFTVTPVSQTAVAVSVATPANSSSGSTFYELSRSPDGTTWGVLTPNAYQWTDGTVAASTTYQYRIRYKNTLGLFSAYSPTKTITTWGAATPTITTGNKKTRNQNTSLAGTATTGTTVKLYFNGTYDGTAINTNGNWTYTTVSKPEGVYTVQAQASLGSAVSAFSAPITLTIDLTPPSPPQNLRITTYHGAIDLEWDPSPSTDVLGYRIFRKTGTGGTWSMILSYPGGYLSGTSKYRDSTVVDGTTYYYHVTAVDDSRND